MFDVLVENTVMLDNFDIFLSAPGKNVPLVVMTSSVPVFITDGTMTIDFVEITGDPHINGIEIIYVGLPIVASPPTAPTAPISIPVPITVPVKPPTKAPVVVPTKLPTKQPVIAPVPIPVPAVVPVPTTNVGNIVHRINCGSTNQVVVPPNNEIGRAHV